MIFYEHPSYSPAPRDGTYYPYDGSNGPAGTPSEYVPQLPGPAVPNTNYIPTLPVPSTPQSTTPPAQTPTTPANTAVPAVPANNESDEGTIEIDGQTMMIAGGIILAILILK